jgi:ABC-type uncharacterized transport system fused permease/ATPase subunit
LALDCAADRYRGSAVGSSVLAEFWNRDFFNALEQKDGTALLTQALLFLPLAAASTVLAILSVWAG